MADTVLATTIAHEIQLIRYSKTIGKDAGVYVDNIMKALREELLSTDKVTTKKQRDELIKFINELFASELGDWNSELESDLTRLIKEEAKFYQASLASLIGEKVARPTLESITKAAYSTEMVLNGQAYTVNGRIKQYDVNSVDKVKRIVTGGWRDGLTTYEMMQQINGKQASSVGNQMRKGANILAKDLTSHISSTAKTKVGMDNSDIVIGEKAVATLDSRTSEKCARIASEDNGGREYIYAEVGYNFERPPHHWGGCRTTHRYLLAPEYEALEEPRTRPAIVNGKARQVDSNEDLFQLAKENKNLAIELVGVERAKVLSAMSAKEFTKVAYNNLDELITIDELVKKSKVAAKALSKD
ncbi:putative head morphogenesis protein [Vibrio phage 1.178.O._10N.286.45.E12]|nr:putative head morphogenesis protein [Vibrio phage 1.178.O._10N.286.45.E12]